MHTFIVAAGMAWAMLAGQSLAAPAGDCESLRPDAKTTTAPQRPITLEDLVRLRDIGPQGDLAGQASTLGISPDEKRVAFVLRQADAVGNRYCSGLFVADIDEKGRAQLIEDAGEPIFGTIDFWGITDYPTGVPLSITPKWSPDGRSIAYLSKREGRIGVRVIRLADGQGRMLRASIGDIDGFAWSGTDILVARARVDVDRSREALAAEGLTGHRYDARFMPMATLKPFPISRPEYAYWTYTPDGGVRAPTSDEQEILEGGKPTHHQDGIASVHLSRAPYPARRTEIVFTDAMGDEDRCLHELCRGAIVDAWLGWDARNVVYLSREGWADEMTAVYLWLPGTTPRRVWATKDLITDCHLVRRDLVCLAESALQSRHIVAIKVDTGRVRPVFDPNPEFSRLRLAPAERLHWRNDRGLPVIADFVRPLDHRPGQKAPLVVVQYVTRGFLRGGTGDEYPIQALAAAGFAVLSFQRPMDVAMLDPDVPAENVAVSNFQDWADRRSVHSALMTGLDLLVARGDVDPNRIGLTGLSDGASSVQFALVNSDRFAAVALSTCCQDPKTQMLVTGPATATAFQRMGFPKSTERAERFWRHYSIAMNASRIKVPVLMQLAEDEYMAGLETYTALLESGAPVEMYVFPDERHIKWQPAHRQAVYARNVRWFEQWLGAR